ncbi:MAG: hypothetical protein JWQ63_3855, partial [Mucilaginibacter sp.]|nr:hypothetical protein [Mucilaginibacter sp.]
MCEAGRLPESGLLGIRATSGTLAAAVELWNKS